MSAFSLSFLIFFGFISVTVVGETVKCYHCNSAEQKECESSDLDDLKQFIAPCLPLNDGAYNGSEAKACRKVLQNVEDMPRVIIRECAYTGDVRMDGMRKQGNKAIKLLYYQCENKDNEQPCNGASSLFSSILALMACLFVALPR